MTDRMPAQRFAQPSRRDYSSVREAIEGVELSMLAVERGRMREQGMTSAIPPRDGLIACDSSVSRATGTAIGGGYVRT